MPDDFNAIGQPYTKANEGCRLQSYRDGGGVWTIGYGHTGPDVKPNQVITQAEADAKFIENYGTAAAEAQQYVTPDCWAAMGVARQAVIVDMAFQLGLGGLRKFAGMHALLEKGEWDAAADDALESEVARVQAPDRWNRHADILTDGDDAIVNGALPTG